MAQAAWWRIQPGTVDPSQRWVWHTRPRFILPLWEHASAATAQRYVRLAQTRKTAGGRAAQRRRRGHVHALRTGGLHSHDNGAEIEALANSNPGFDAWEQNEPYTIALLIKDRLPGNPVKVAQPTLCLCELSADMIGCDVALLFHNGDPRKPLIVGRIVEPAWAAGHHPLPRPRGVPRWRAVWRSGARHVPALRAATCGASASAAAKPYPELLP